MIPLYKVTVNGKEVSSTGDARLVELTVSDEVGLKSDSFSLILDDSDRVLEFPRRGVEAHISMGLGRLVDMGVFFVDSILPSEPPSVLKVAGKAAPYITGKAMQTRNSASYEGISLADLARTIAGRYGLEVLASEEAGK